MRIAAALQLVVRSVVRSVLVRLVLVGSVLAGSVLAGACATNPATGETQLSLIGEEQEIALGRQADAEIVASMGLYGDEELQRYVQGIGQDLASSSERPDLPWTFRVIDTSTPNAFALPGGFIYITRGMLVHLENEAELAGVIGHEIGHVTGRHSVEQLSQQQLAGAGLSLGLILAPRLKALGEVAETGLGLLFLKFSRDDERQADDLGLRYMVRDGYDPRQLPDVFATLDRVSRAEGGGRIPVWLSTHPDPGERSTRLRQRAQAIAAQMDSPTVDRGPYLAHLDGVAFGDDPREGFFEGNTFHHPGLAFSIDLPAGWATANQPQAVGAMSPEQDAVVELALSDRASANAAAQEFFSAPGIRSGRRLREGIAGSPTVARMFRATDESGTELTGIAAFVEHQGRVFQLLGFAAASAWEQRMATLQSSLSSFRETTDPRILQARPEHIDIVELPEAMTLAEFAQRYPSTVDLATLALINATDARERFPAGARLKRVVRERPEVAVRKDAAHRLSDQAE